MAEGTLAYSETSRAWFVPISLQPTRSNVLLFAGTLAASTVGAVAIGQAHTGHGIACGAMYAVLFGAVFGWVLFGRIPEAMVRVLSSGTVWLVLLALIACADQVHYVRAQGGDDPLTSAQALEAPARALLEGREPYSVHLSHGAPISPGPGWLLLLMPVTVPHGTGLLGMAGLGCAAWCLRRRGTLGAGLFCLMLLCGPLFESQAANGQDLYVIGLACVALALLLEGASERPAEVAAWSVVAGFVATARLPMIAILPVMGLGLYRRKRRSGVIFLVLMPLTAALLDGGFALWAARAGDRFQPVHIFGRGTAAAGTGTETAVALLTMAALGWVLLRMRGDAAHWMLGTWMVMSGLFVPEAVKEFGQMHHDLRWEGSTYLTFSLPLIVAALTLGMQRSRILRGNP